MWKSAALFVTLAIAMPDAAKVAEELQRQQVLFDGFLQKSGMAELRFFEALNPEIRKYVRHWCPSLWADVEDIQQQGILTSLEWREDRPTEVCPLLQRFVERITGADVQRRRRGNDRKAEITQQIKEERAAPEGTPDSALDIKRLLALAATGLPAPQNSVLLHQAAHEQGDGPPLHEVLELTPDLARRRLAHAQKNLYRLANPAPAEVANG